MRLALAMLCCSLVALAAAGCSGAGADNGEARAALDSWFRDASRVALDSQARMTLSLAQIDVKPPPSRGQLEALDADGIAIGDEARASAREFSEATGNADRDVQALYCELLLRYAGDDPSVPFDRYLIIEMEWSLGLSQYPRARLEETLTRLKAIGERAKSLGGEALQIASATVCSP